MFHLSFNIVLLCTVWFGVVCLSFTSALLTPTQNIDAIAQKYLLSERHLWHLIRSSDYYDHYNTLMHIYHTHEEYLQNGFGETGIFDRISRELYRDRNEDNVQKYRKVIDSMQYINITTLNAYRFLAHQNYNDFPSLMQDIGDNMPNLISNIRANVNFQFWTIVKNVSSLCTRFNAHIYIQLVNFAEIVFV